MQFGEIDSMLPMKVNIPDLETKSYVGGDMALKTGGLPNVVAMQETSSPYPVTAGQWTNAVHAISPFLGAEGLRRALAILNLATANLQQMQALEDMALSQAAAGIVGGGQANLQHPAMLAMMQVQLQDQQCGLYKELQQLPIMEGMPKQTCQNLVPSSIAPAPMRLDLASMMLQAQTTAATPVAAPVKTTTSGAALAQGRQRPPQTLSASLRSLEVEDPECILIVRRISKLGFKATQSLKKHFSAYGPVVKVLLAHSTARQYCDQQFHVKRRPSNLGFIQMGTAEAAKLVLSQGASHEVEGIAINVQRFERHDDNGELANEQDDIVEEPLQLKDASAPGLVLKSTRPRGMSDLSTCASDVPFERSFS